MHFRDVNLCWMMSQMVESNSNRFELVDSDEKLNELCQALYSEKLLALDT